MTRTEYHRIDAPSLGGSGEIAVHGHWGRPVIWFPSEAGAPWDFEANGMLAAVRPAIDEGRQNTVILPSSIAGRTAASMPLASKSQGAPASEGNQITGRPQCPWTAISPEPPSDGASMRWYSVRVI